MVAIKYEPAFTFTAVQEQLLQLRYGDKKIAVELDVTTPVRICSGHDPIEYDSDWYEPRGVEIGSVGISGQALTTDLIIDNADGEMSELNFNETFSNTAVTVHFFLKDPSTATWTHVLTLSWTCESIEWDLESFGMKLSWGVGVRPRAGLEVASKRCPLTTHWDITASPRGGPLCKYDSTDTRCTGTWDDCKSKSNTEHFRGWRLAPEPGYSLKVKNGSFQFQGGFFGVDPPPGDSGEDEDIIYRGGSGRRVIPDPPSPPVAAGGLASSDTSGQSS